MTDFITQIDFNILNAIQSIRTPFLDTIMPLITFLGSGGIVWAVTALIMLCFKKSRKTGIVIIVSLLLGLFLSTMGLKNVIARERPYNTEGALLTIENLLIGAPSGRFSFPSGHAISSFSSATVILLYSKKLGIPAIILAALICGSCFSVAYSIFETVSVCTFSVRRYLRCVVRNIARVLVKLLSQ